MRFALRFSPALAMILIGSTATTALAGGPFSRRRVRNAVETVREVPRPQDRVAASPMLGTFLPTPMISVRDNGVIGGGYSPLGMYGRENSLTLFGPLSAFRATSAPITTVVRGYDGRPVLVDGVSFSNPNQPDLSPVVYPTRASNYSALPFQGTPPQRDKSLMWIDQN